MKKREMTIFGRFKSIRDAMMLSFSVLVVVAVLIFLLIAMNFTKKTIYENSRTSTSQLISHVWFRRAWACTHRVACVAHAFGRAGARIGCGGALVRL